MPRIKKIKFESAGKHHHDTTFTGYITLDLYYDSKGEYFYFEAEQIVSEIKTVKDKFAWNRHKFYKCKKLEDAVAMISNLIYDNLFVDAERYLAIFIKSDKLEDKSRVSTHSDAQESANVSIGFSRFLKVTNSQTGERSIVKCSKDWTLKKNDSLLNAEDRYVFIKWTEHREGVLRSTMDRLELLRFNISKYFEDAVEKGNLEIMLDSSISLLENNPKH